MALPTIPMSLYFKGNKTYGVGSISFDLLMSEQHTFNNQVSDHNVEDGSVIADHIKNELENGSIVGLITNFSIRATNIEFSNRAQKAFDELVDLWKRRELVTVVTVMRVYTDVAITGVSVARSAETGEAIALNISFRKVRIVKLKQVSVSASIKINGMDTDINKQVAPQVDMGQQSGNDFGADYVPNYTGTP